MLRRIAPVLLTGAVGCGGPGWEESHRLRLDGSGESVVRVEPSRLPPATGRDPADALGELLSGPGLRLEQVRSLGDGRVEGRVSFASLEALCRAPLFRRECAYRSGEEGFSIRMTAPVPTDRRAMHIEVRPEARITSHNSDGPIRRGNRLRWRLGGMPAAEESGETAPVLRLTTDATSVFSATVRTVLRAGAIAGGTTVLGLLVLFLEGRRRLRRARPDQAPAIFRKSPG